MRVAITGSSGLIGTALTTTLRSSGHHVTPVVRNKPSIPDVQIAWNPDAGTIDVAGLEGHDVVINLAGESIAGLRWTRTKKRRIYQSRTRGTTALAKALAQLNPKPAVLLSASAFGYYGNRPPAERVAEDAPPGNGFLSEVVTAWEAATQPASDAGIRVAHLRLGLVLAGRGGVLQAMLLPFRLGLGGRLGSGTQMMPWIELGDAVNAMLHVIEHPELSGAVNTAAPGAVSNAEFTRTLAQVLHRPAVIPVPAFAVRLALGQMGQELLLDGAATWPKRLLDTGFAFRFPELGPALRHVLRPTPDTS